MSSFVTVCTYMFMCATNFRRRRTSSSAVRIETFRIDNFELTAWFQVYPTFGAREIISLISAVHIPPPPLHVLRVMISRMRNQMYDVRSIIAINFDV